MEVEKQQNQSKVTGSRSSAGAGPALTATWLREPRPVSEAVEVVPCVSCGAMSILARAH